MSNMRITEPDYVEFETAAEMRAFGVDSAEFGLLDFELGGPLSPWQRYAELSGYIQAVGKMNGFMRALGALTAAFGGMNPMGVHEAQLQLQLLYADRECVVEVGYQKY